MEATYKTCVKTKVLQTAIKMFLENPQYFITSPASKGWLDWIPDSLYLRVLYRAMMGEKCNLKNPVTYNEKLQWLKINDRKPEYSNLVDKYEVRKTIEKTLFLYFQFCKL